MHPLPLTVSSFVFSSNLLFPFTLFVTCTYTLFLLHPIPFHPLCQTIFSHTPFNLSHPSSLAPLLLTLFSITPSSLSPSLSNAYFHYLAPFPYPIFPSISCHTPHIYILLYPPSPIPVIYGQKSSHSFFNFHSHSSLFSFFSRLF